MRSSAQDDYSAGTPSEKESKFAAIDWDQQAR
jgi:hypothetical protein